MRTHLLGCAPLPCMIWRLCSRIWATSEFISAFALLKSAQRNHHSPPLQNRPNCDYAYTSHFQHPTPAPTRRSPCRGWSCPSVSSSAWPPWCSCPSSSPCMSAPRKGCPAVVTRSMCGGVGGWGVGGRRGRWLMLFEIVEMHGGIKSSSVRGRKSTNVGNIMPTLANCYQSFMVE